MNLRAKTGIRHLLQGRWKDEKCASSAFISIDEDADFDGGGRVVCKVLLWAKAGDQWEQVGDSSLRLYPDGLGSGPLEGAIMDGPVQGVIYQVSRGPLVQGRRRCLVSKIVYDPNQQALPTSPTTPPTEAVAPSPQGAAVSQVPVTDGMHASGPSKPAAEAVLSPDPGPRQNGSERGQPRAGGALQTEALASQGSGRGSLRTSQDDRAGQNKASSDTPTPVATPPPAAPLCPKCGQPATVFDGQWVHCGERVA